MLYNIFFNIKNVYGKPIQNLNFLIDKYEIIFMMKFFFDFHYFYSKQILKLNE